MRSGSFPVCCTKARKFAVHSASILYKAAWLFSDIPVWVNQHTQMWHDLRLQTPYLNSDLNLLAWKTAKLSSTGFLGARTSGIYTIRS